MEVCMKKTVLSLLMCSLLFSAAGAWAAGQMKPGLWEITMKSDAKKNMPKIPPKQKKKMREMGIDMPQMSDGGMVTKVCITLVLVVCVLFLVLSLWVFGCFLLFFL